ncbi:MAG: response regulator transcription factor [candidate division Zixibacteria bacterium]|nr:response regulator transcription factor [candidate division Zixibacteria bacterium]
MRILLIEDNSRVAEAVAKNLKTESLAVDLAPDGETGEYLANTNDYDVIVLDIMLPGRDGWQTCERLRRGGLLTPILMLTALDEVEDRVRGLEIGADDYLTKPFHIKELLARIRSLARRHTDVRSSTIEKYGLTLDLSTHKASRNNRDITLTAKEFALLELFLHNPGRIVTRAEISEHLWDMNFDPKSNVIESFIRYLRKKVDRDFDTPLIHTVRGSGYLFSDEAP